MILQVERFVPECEVDMDDDLAGDDFCLQRIWDCSIADLERLLLITGHLGKGLSWRIFREMSDVCINKLGRRDVICNHPVRYRLRPSKKSLEPPSTMLPLMIGSHTSDL